MAVTEMGRQAGADHVIQAEAEFQALGRSFAAQNLDHERIETLKP